MNNIRYQWNGVTKTGIYSKDYEDTVQTMFTNLKNEDWDSVIATVSKYGNLVNCVRPGSDSYYTILHGAARKGAPIDTVEKMIMYGALRAMKTKNGELAVDIAHKYGHNTLVPVLTPKYNCEVDPDALKNIEQNFHALIIKETDDFVSKYSLRLPELEVLLEIQDKRVYFPIPGMMGGVFFTLNTSNGKCILNVQIESRMWGGADYFEVTSEGIKVVKRES